ncbi:MAG: PilZ domain-containing protein [Chloroflexi bacterium]|nr:PilZ domain-containing protein [Chloroflexota bacterium]
MTTASASQHIPHLKLAVTERVELELVQQEEPERYPTRIAAVQGPLVTVEAPLRKLDMVPIPAGSQVRLWASRQYASFSAQATVEAAFWAPIAALVLRLTSPWARFQHRSSVRLETLMQPELAELALPDGRSFSIDLSVRNLSVGGALLVTKRTPKKPHPDIGPRLDAGFLREHLSELRIRLLLPLSGSNQLELTGRLVRVEEVEEELEYLLRLAVQFVDTPLRHEDMLFRFIFEEQKRRRRKGL